MTRDPQDHTNMDPQHKRSDRFSRKIAIWNLEGEQKSNVAQQVIDDLTTKLEYWSQMFLSIVVATLGLLINATPVVIGAMIIAPILRPIQGLSFATATGNRHVFIKALWVLVVSILLGVCTGLLLTLLVPLTEVTHEIAMRTQPTLIDLGIAFASGLVAFLALGWKKMAAGLAGVAMAASLVPPLAVIGIGIGFGSMSIARGSTVLFLTNLIAIIIGGIIVCYLFGFYPTHKDDLRRSMRNTSFAIGMMIILSIPLATSLITISRQVTTKRIATETITNFLENIDGSIAIERIDIENNNAVDTINLSIKVPQQYTQELTIKEQETLTTLLSRTLKNDVTLRMSLIPITTVTQAQAETINTQDLITERIEMFISTLYHDTITLLDVNFYTRQQNIVVVSMFTEEIINKQELQISLETYIQDNIPDIDKVIINWQHDTNNDIPLLTPNQQLQDDITKNFKNYFSQSVLHKLQVTSMKDSIYILMQVSTPIPEDNFREYMQEREYILYELYGKEILTTTYINQLVLLDDMPTQ